MRWGTVRSAATAEEHSTSNLESKYTNDDCVVAARSERFTNPMPLSPWPLAIHAVPVTGSVALAVALATTHCKNANSVPIRLFGVAVRRKLFFDNGLCQGRVAWPKEVLGVRPAVSLPMRACGEHAAEGASEVEKQPSSNSLFAKRGRGPRATGGRERRTVNSADWSARSGVVPDTYVVMPFWNSRRDGRARNAARSATLVSSRSI
jgi:hypothetical protein